MNPKIKEVRCGGYFFASHVLNYLTPQITPFILAGRQKYVLGDEECAGSRYCSDVTVFGRITSGLYNACLEPHTLTPEERDYLIEQGLRDCARADYWYRYEKDWGSDKDDYRNDNRSVEADREDDE